MSNRSIENFLSGGGVSAKWPQVGYVVEGTVTSMEMRQQTDYDTGELLTWNDGSPRMQLVMGVQGEPTGETWTGLRNVRKALPDDDGHRVAYVKGGLQKALSQALRDAKAKPEIGAYVRIERIADGAKTDPKKEAPHQYRVTWTPKAANSKAAEDFLAGDEPGNGNPF